MTLHTTMAQSQPDTGAVHPLDPLSAAEIRSAAAVIRRHYAWGHDLRVETIDVDEPDKDLVRDHAPGTPVHRIALSIPRWFRRPRKER